MLKVARTSRLFGRSKRPSGALEPTRVSEPWPLAFRGSGRAFSVLLWGVFALTFLKGFRFPSLWCATHFTFNYSQGFVRRGLVGEVARRIFGDAAYRYDVFLGFSWLVFALVGLLIALSIRRLLRASREDWAFRVALLVVCSSTGMIFLVHAVGYFDFLGLLAVLCVLWWAERSRTRFGIFYALAVVGLILPWVHEGLVIMFGPTALFIALCHWRRALHGRQPTVQNWLLFCGFSAALVLLVGSLLALITGPAEPARVQALQALVRRHADFAPRPDAFKVLTETTARNIRVVVPGYWRLHAARVQGFLGQIAFVPGFLFVLFCALRELAAAERSKWLRAAFFGAFLGASVAPELMNIVAWDWPRWNSMALACAAICLLSYKLYFPAANKARASLSLLTVGLLLTAVGLASTTMLFDGYEVQFFPFAKQFDFIDQVIEGGFRYRPKG